MNGRRRMQSLGAALASAALVVLAACDAGDGRQLTPYDPADYPSQTSPPSTEAFNDFVNGAGVDFEDFDAGQYAPSLEPAPSEAFQVFAPWAAGGAIDPRYTCDGDNTAPAVSWGAIPDGTVEIAIALVDDSAVSNGEPFVHWVITGLDPYEIALVEGDVPAGAVQALNFFGDIGYGGPCPPPGGGPHEYRLSAYALNSQLELADGTRAVEVLDAISNVTSAVSEIVATYER